MAESTLRLSVIVPVYNNLRDLSECVAALHAQAASDVEILVVDDGSTDDTAEGALALGVTVLRMPANAGPAAARNHGAQHARGDVLFFVDADVVVRPGTIERIRRVFVDRPDVAAVFGSYDATPRVSRHVSRYRNLLHHFVHQNGHGEASTFWAGCGAIRRRDFDEIGGFDERRFRRPSIEDIELGHRLRRAGRTILLDKRIQGTHLKQWTLVSMIRTDILQRAIPWSRLTLETEMLPDTLNVAWDQRLSAMLVALSILVLPFAVLKIELAAVAALALAGVVALNRQLYLFFFRCGGLVFALVSMTLHMTYFVYSGLSYVFAVAEHHLPGWFVTRRRASVAAK
ncbi:MAG TPA: glycosyltransferase family 2 protein [Methylomirabilota bacterium]|nr:glycosyltransferase family 2 protein [Methylomirabilota bacterium]